MAFDLKTAKPVSGGFDLRTAKPVAAPRPQRKKKEEEGGFLQDIKDVGTSLGLATVGLAKPFAYLAERLTPGTYSLPARKASEALASAEEFLKGARSEADIERQRVAQARIEEEAKAPGELARGIAGVRQFIEGPKRPEASRTMLSGIADYLSPTRAIASLIPETPEAAQREISTVKAQFNSPIEAAQFAASQIPSTAATVLTGGLTRGAKLAAPM